MPDNKEELLQRIHYLENVVKNNEDNSKLRLNLALDSAKIGIHEWDIVNNKFIWDDRMFEFWGIPLGTELNYDLVTKGIHPDDKLYVNETLKDFLSKGSIGKYSLQHRVIGISTGIVKCIELTGHVIYENKKPVRIIGTAIDITQRKREEDFRSRWENIFHFAKWGISVIPIGLNVLELINPEYARMHGYTVDELTGKSLDTVIAPEFVADIPRHLSLSNENEHHVWETLHVRKDKSKFPVKVDLTTVKSEDNIPLYRIVNVTDLSQRKLIEQAAKDTENHYRQLFQNLNSNFAAHEIILDESGNPVDYRFLEVNTAMEKATGLKASEMIGKTAKELFPGTEQYWIDKFGEVALSGESTSYENYSAELDRYYELKLYSPQKGEFAMLASDITERKLAEKNLKESKDHFELLFNLNPDAVTIIRLNDYKIINVNTGFLNLLGYSYEEVIGKTTIDLNVWEDAEERSTVQNLLKQNGCCENFEARYLRKDGTQIIGIVSSKIIDINGTLHILTVTRDITSRKKIENALKESEKVLKESQKIAGLGTYTLDFCTGNWESTEILDSIFGIDKTYDKSIGGWFKLIHPDWAEMVQDYWQSEIIDNKQKFDKEYVIVRYSDKREIWVHGLGELTFNDDGSLHYMTGTIMDISDRKQDELIIQKQNTELLKMNATKDMLFSIIAHDLRSPFGTLISSHEILKEYIEEANTTEAERWCSIIGNVSNQAYNLLENLLDWFKVQTGQLTPRFYNIELKQLVDEVIYLFNEPAHAKCIAINNNIDKNTLVLADKNITKTIIRNLINNAVKFTENNGAISIYSFDKKEYNEVVVIDNGVGMSSETITDLFSVKMNKSTPGTSKERGSGLGLNICKDLVEIQGGKIWVESEPGKGSQFHFTIATRS